MAVSFVGDGNMSARSVAQLIPIEISTICCHKKVNQT